jgi:prepilin-type N-terminal cleavage/methylation domain-containing protein/prepilin-type processing-associated H-X9-DG protein
VRDVKSNSRDDGFTMVELLVVIVIISILAALLLPALTGGKKRATRIVCESQLREIGIADQSFAHDHNSKFPALVSTNDGGSMEFFENGDFTNTFSEFRAFQPLGTMLSTPKLLVCPTDSKLPAASFFVLQNSNVSYFAGVNAQYDQPMSILAGDGNLASSSPLVLASAGSRLTWNSKLHEFKGNVLFSDGHVEEWSDYGGPTLAATVTVALPVGGGGAPSPSQTGMANRGGAAAQFGTASQPGNTNSTAAGDMAAQMSQPACQPAGSPANPSPSKPGLVVSTIHGNLSRAGSGPSQSDQMNPVTEEVAPTTNASPAKTSVTPENDSTMSPTNRKIAWVLRDTLVGIYLLILLLVLLYAGYRTWRSRQLAERRRRLKLAQAQAHVLSEW